MQNKRKIPFLVSMIITVILLVIIPIFINNDFLKDNVLKGTYLGIKIVFSLMLLFTIFYLSFAKTANAIMIIFTPVAIGLQLVPLFIRLMASATFKGSITKKNYLIGYSIFFAVGLIVFVSIILFGLLVINKRMAKSDEKYQADEIPLGEKPEEEIE